ncbi:MAG: M12 family metallo-peptidase [Bacteroidota bacterium]|nr:M12 family metallo-peptidase [Bacteroidota bacterium]MDP4232893.1 M12 family metallo-peptidase [Bacteroidota bacterium]MDP4241937.1 M12 family metallo-peptidase [Bacteroidota bacterium]MDP4286840.1 M12 family metallo-peptidase [Bacteroidota bacterium]
MRFPLLAFLVVGVLLFPILSYSSTSEGMLFRVASQIPVPANARGEAAFLEMDRTTFATLASWRDFICVIPDFPLAQNGAHDLRVAQFEAVAPDIKGRFPVPAHVFLRGSVDGIAGSHVCLTLFEDRAWGYINANGKTYTITAAGRAESGNLILGVVEDTVPAASFNCGVEDWKTTKLPPQVIASPNRNNSPLEFPLGSTIMQLTVALEMDYPCVQQVGGGSDTAAFKYGLSVLAAADDLYMRDVSISLVCSAHYEWTTPDPYPDTAACWILDYFDGSNLPPSNPSMRVLFSGRNTDWCGGLAAGIGVLCSATDAKCICGIKNTLSRNGWNYPYSTWTWDAMVSAHEMGHLVACPHTHNCWWNPPLDSCVPAEGDCYANPVASKGTIMSYCHTTPAGAILKFHPRCSTWMDQQVEQISCKTLQPIVTTTITPTRRIQTCAPTVTFTVTATNGAAPYTFGINSTPLSSTINGNACTLTLKPKQGAVYIRITDANGIRAYDSVVFVPSGYGVSVTEDSLPAGRDSVILTATPTDTTGATCVWSILPTTAGRTIGSGWNITLPRLDVATKYRAKATSGVCIAYDTVTVNARQIPARGVADRTMIQFRIYPNPAHDHITALVPADGSRFWIEDVLGRRMNAAQARSSLSNSISDGEQIDFDLSTVPAGAYWIVRDAAATITISSFQKW